MEMETHPVYFDRDITRQSSGETKPIKAKPFFFTNYEPKEEKVRETAMEHKIHQAWPLEPGSSFAIAVFFR